MCIGCGRILEMEKACFTRVRESRPIHVKIFAILLIVVVVVYAACVPLLIAGVSSYWDIDGVRDERDEAVSVGTNRNLDHKHMFGIISSIVALLVSLLGYLIWLFFSPHMASEGGGDLDRLRTFLFICMFILRVFRFLIVNKC